MKQLDLRNLSRGELLEILVRQGEELETLRQENENYRAQLKEKRIVLQEAGSIAEAALQVSGIFEAAQQAAQQYLNSIAVLSEQKEKDAAQAKQLREETEAACAAMREETRQQCESMLERAKRESLSYWTKISRKLENFR